MRSPSYLHLLLLLFANAFITALAGQTAAADISIYYARADSLREAGAYPAARVAITTTDSLAQLRGAPPRQRGEIELLKARITYNLGDYPTAFAAAESAAKRFDALGLPGRQADGYLWMGHSVWYLQGTAATLPYFDRAIALAETDTDELRGYRGKYYADRALAHMYLGEFRAAEPLVRAAIRRDSSYYGYYHPRTAESLMILANYYHFREDNPQALATYLSVSEIYDSIYVDPYTPNHGSLYGNIGKSYFNQSQFSRAEDYYLRALAVFQRILPANHFNTLLVYTLLGDIYFNLGDQERTTAYYRKARENNTDNDRFIATITTFGSVFELEAAGAYQRANDTLRQLMPAMQELYGNSNNWAMTLERIGDNARHIGQMDTARFYFRQAARVYADNAGERSSTQARIYAQLAETFLSERQLDSVRHYADAGLALVWDRHRDFDQVGVPDIFSKLLDLRAISHQYTTTGPPNDNLRAALRDYDLADAYYDHLRSTYVQTPDKSYLESTIADTHEKAIRLCLELSRTDPSYREKAFYYSEKNKAYLLLETLQRAGIPALDDFLAARRDLRADVNYYLEQLAATADATDPETEYRRVNWRARIAELNRRAEELERDARQQNKELFRTLDQPTYKSIADVQAGLADDEGLLEYFVGNNSVFVFLIRQREHRVVELPRSPGLDSLVQQLRKSLRQPAGSTLKRYSSAAHELYKQLVAPVADQLPSRLLVIPDGILNYVPFEALLTEAVTELYRPAAYPYLLVDHQISYNYSVTLLEQLRRDRNTPATPRRALGMAPFAGVDQKTVASRSVAALGNLPDHSALPPLPGSLREVTHLVDRYGADAYYGDSATLARFLELASHYRILHLSTHGRAEVGQGIEPYILFAPNRAEQTYAPLYVRDLYTLQLQADLVVLSACETGLGELRKGEGLQSLARAFAHAGARSLITTLWSVDDSSTEEILTDFYEYYLAGASKDAALHQAKLNYLNRHTGTRAHPGRWAGLVGVGDVE